MIDRSIDGDLNNNNAVAKFNLTDLQELQSLPLWRKIQITMSRIVQFHNRFPDKIYVSFSGGKDSTVLLDIVRRCYPNTPAVFVDTGLEYPEVREFVKSKENVVILRPKMNFRKVIETYGYPMISKETALQIEVARRNPGGKTAKKFDPGNEHDKKYKGFSIVRWGPVKDSDIPISSQCCMIMKKNPAKLFEKETGMHPITGMMACESINRATQWLGHGCNIYDGRRPISNPMSFWTEQDVLEYIQQRELDYAPVYGKIYRASDGLLYTTKCERTGCVFCLFGAHLEKEPSRLQKLMLSHPTLYNYCMKPFREGGLGMKDIIDRFNLICPPRTHIFY